MKLSMIFLSLCLSGCVFPRLPLIERCGIFLRPSLAESKCRCHTYRFDVVEGRRESLSVDHPLPYCDRGVVFRTNEGGAWESLTSWRDEFLLWLADHGEGEENELP